MLQVFIHWIILTFTQNKIICSKINRFKVIVGIIIILTRSIFAGNKVFLLRDYSSQVNSIENTKGQKCRLRMSRMKLLHELSTPDNYNVTFDYHGPTGLLKTKLDSTGRSYVYNYDEFGRLTSAVMPTGKMISLGFDLSIKGMYHFKKVF